MSQKVSANVAFIHLNDRIIKQKNYIKYLEEQLKQRNYDCKKLLDENNELKQSNTITNGNDVIRNDVIDTPYYEENKNNEILLKVTEVNKETSLENKIFNFNDINSLKGLTLGHLIKCKLAI